MSELTPQTLLRAGLLEGVGAAIASAAAGAQSAEAREIRSALRALGARAESWRLPGEADPEQAEALALDSLRAVLGDLGECHMLIVDGGGLLAAQGAGAAPLLGAMEACWLASRTLANECFLADERGGQIVLIAPSPDAGEHAGAALAGLENLARTLSIEWARFGVRVVAIAPGAVAPPAEVATLVAYLASPAGDYFSGCLLDLRGAD